MSLIRRLSTLARSPQGRRAVNQAVEYARGPRGRQHLEKVRERLAAQKRRPRP